MVWTRRAAGTPALRRHGYGLIGAGAGAALALAGGGVGVGEAGAVGEEGFPGAAEGVVEGGGGLGLASEPPALPGEGSSVYGNAREKNPNGIPASSPRLRSYLGFGGGGVSTPTGLRPATGEEGRNPVGVVGTSGG